MKLASRIWEFTVWIREFCFKFPGFTTLHWSEFKRLNENKQNEQEKNQEKNQEKMTTKIVLKTMWLPVWWKWLKLYQHLSLHIFWGCNLEKILTEPIHVHHFGWNWRWCVSTLDYDVPNFQRNIFETKKWAELTKLSSPRGKTKEKEGKGKEKQKKKQKNERHIDLR